MKQVIFCAAAALAMAMSASATIIVSDTSGGTAGSQANSYFVVSWTPAANYTGVSIMANLESSSGNPVTGTAYFSNALGPGATVANQLGTTPISTTNTAAGTLTTLFTGESLVAGTTYYLLIQENGGLLWLDASSPVQTLDSGVTQGPDQTVGTVGSPVISSTFTNTANGHLLFSVTGTGTVNSTPEPSTLAMLALGMVAVALRLRPVIERG